MKIVLGILVFVLVVFFIIEQGGKFFVRIESSETVSGVELIEMAKELGWQE